MKAGRAFVLVLSMVATSRLGAQNQNPFSVQASVLANALSGSDFEGINTGFGAELQLRRRISAWSFGGGVQWTAHSVDAQQTGISGNARLLGVFFEPRYVLPFGGSAAPYLGGRLAWLQMKQKVDADQTFPTFTATFSGLQANLGGGVLMPLTPRVNLDLGATVGIVSFGNGSIDTPGIQTTTEKGSGTNLVLRAGISVGLGGGK